MGSSIDVLHEAFKIAHTYTFLTKNFYGFEIVFFALWFWDFLHVLYAYYAERKFCHKYTYALSPVWNRPPIYAHYMREKFRPDIYEKSRRGRNDVCEIDWALVSWRSFVSRFVYAVIVWIRSFLLIGRCQSFIVKAWWNRINSL